LRLLTNVKIILRTSTIIVGQEKMEENEIIQGLLDFESGNTNGIENWHREQEEYIVAIRKEWSLPVEKNVRVKLKDIDYEFEGKLKLAERPTSIDKRIPLHLSVDSIDLFPSDIEKLVVIDKNRM